MNNSEVTQYVGIDTSSSQLVYLNNSDDMDADEFSLRLSLLDKHPVTNISRLLQDAHLYVFKRWVIDLISEVSNKRTMASIKEHVLPLLVKSQHQRVLADREGVTKGADIAKVKIMTSAQTRLCLLLIDTTLLLKIAVEAAMAANPNIQKLALSLSTTQPSKSEDADAGEWKSPVVCRAFVLPNEIYCGRANTIPNYFEINRYVSSIPFFAVCQVDILGLLFLGELSTY